MGVPTLIHGENAVITVSGGALALAVDGEVDITIEKNAIEKNLRGVPVIYHILSKKVKLSGSFTGVPNANIWTDIMADFTGADEVSSEVDLASIKEQENIEIKFEVGTESFILKDVKFTQVKPESPDDDVVKVGIEFVANGIKKG